MRALTALLLLLLTAAPAHAEAPERWAVYYTNTLPAQAFRDYGLLVFDSHARPDLRSLRAPGRVLLGYLSLGEAAAYRDYFPLLKKNRWLLTGNVIDVRSPAWSAYVVEVLVPQLLAQGFDGLFLDTVDTVAAEKEASIRLIRSLRMHYPEIPIMLNRGFAVLPEVANEVDSVLAESIYSFHDAKTGESRLQPAAHYASVADFLKTTQAKFPHLKIYTLDYWPASDQEGVKAIYAAQRANGFIPYVADFDLQQLREEPR